MTDKSLPLTRRVPGIKSNYTDREKYDFEGQNEFSASTNGYTIKGLIAA